SFGSIVMAPIDCTGCLSKTGLKVVAESLDFQTPPLAAPPERVIFPSISTASTAAIRPLMTAEPMLRAPRPEIVAESKRTAGVWAAEAMAVHDATATPAAIGLRRFILVSSI